MGLLTPLYFLGALSIAAPILFHLIRQQPKGAVPFSSLMFLSPTPPTLTRRSRLDNWPLLLLRALALLLLALAFARPFLRNVAQTDPADLSRRVVLLMDTSASMRREDLWQQAVQEGEAVLLELSSADAMAVMSFDRLANVHLGFDSDSQDENIGRKEAARAILAELQPTWQSARTGDALRAAAELIQSTEAEEDAVGHSMPAKVVLVSDFTKGAELDSLQAFEWPSEIAVEVRTVVPSGTTNATVWMMGDSNDEVNSEVEQASQVVRVINDEASEYDNFELAWQRIDGSIVEESVSAIQVSPGESQTIRMPTPDSGEHVERIVLSGDDHDFDNTRFFVSPSPETFSFLYVGDVSDDDDPRASLYYYMQRLPLDDTNRQVRVVWVSPQGVPTITKDVPSDSLADDSAMPGVSDATLSETDIWPPDVKTCPLVVVGDSVSTEVQNNLKDYVDEGGQVLVVLADKQRAESTLAIVETLTGLSDWSVREAEVSDYVMMTQIDFADPVFAAMADPQFNDFTKIRFWNHRKVQVPSIEESDSTIQVLASFDSGDPALIRCQVGPGRVWVMAAGWQPEASQLALSTKFIPWMVQMFRGGIQQPPLGSAVVFGDELPSDLFSEEQPAELSKPNGDKVTLASRQDLAQMDTPGVYRIERGESSSAFAANLAESESRTGPRDVNELPQYGVSLEVAVAKDQVIAERRQLRDQELESRQGWWQWLLVAALVMIGLETWLGGRSARQLA